MNIGHNGADAAQLKTLIDRIEKLQDEKKDVADTIKDVFAEAKAHGYDVKIMRKILAERKRSLSEVEEEQHLLDTYRRALGMLVCLDD